jgi:ribosome-associated protein
MSEMNDDLGVGGRFTIPAAELSWRFDTSGGPGGQHANRSATRVELVFALATSTAFDPATRDLILRRLGARAAGGTVTVVADDTRSQWRNRRLARRRLADLLADAARPEPVRRATRRPARAQRRRLEHKRRRGLLKRSRKPPEPDDG